MKIVELPLRSAAAMLLALPVLAFLPGCLGNDDSSPEDGTLNEAQDEVADGITEMAMQLDQQIAETIPSLFANGVSSPTRETVEWSSTTETWIITVSEIYEDDRANGQVDVTETVQFLQNGVPVQYPDELTTAVHVTVLGTNAGNVHPAAAGWDADFAFTVDRTWSVARNPAGDIDIDGNGSVGGSTTYHVGTHDFPRTTSLEWVTNLAYIVGNPCVTGTIVGSTATHNFTASFNGAGVASWEVVRDGNVVRTGSLTYTCAGPGA